MTDKVRAADPPHDHGEAVKRALAHAVGIARDIADAFNQEHSDWANSGPLFRKLVDELLTEPELVRAIVAWHQATERMVEGTPPGHQAESDRSISDRARGLLAQLEALGIRSVLSAHHEEWWRIHADHERLQREVLQVLHDGLRARQRAADRLVSQAQSDAAVEALASAEMPQAVPGRARDLAARLENFSRASQMGGSWTVGMAVDFLRQIADHWNRRPAAGMNLSQDEGEMLTVPVVSKFGDPMPIGWLKLLRDKLPPTPNYVFSLGFMALDKVTDAPGSVPRRDYVGRYQLREVAITSDTSYLGYLRQTGAAQGPSVHATPVLLETTAMWAGAQTSQSDGAVHFTREAWEKFVQALGAEPPLEILVPPPAPCGCREGECESKPDRLCRMTQEIREGGHQ